MKKFTAILLGLLIAASVFAQTKVEGEENVFYINIPVVCVFDNNNAYVVNYKTNSHELKTLTLPKEWFKVSRKEKCKVRVLPDGVQAYMTVFYSNNVFIKAYLNMPTDHNDVVWQVLPNNVDISSKLNTDVSGIKVYY